VHLSEVRTSDLTDIDVLIYQTFPDEKHPKKFDKELVAVTDPLFRAFKGLKLLFDAHDEPYKDAYFRFSRIRPYPYTIKCFINLANKKVLGLYRKGGRVVYIPDVDPPEKLLGFIESKLPSPTTTTTTSTVTTTTKPKRRVIKRKSTKKRKYTRKKKS
jgi:hypothetical protein